MASFRAVLDAVDLAISRGWEVMPSPYPDSLRLWAPSSRVEHPRPRMVSPQLCSSPTYTCTREILILHATKYVSYGESVTWVRHESVKVSNARAIEILESE